MGECVFPVGSEVSFLVNFFLSTRCKTRNKTVQTEIAKSHVEGVFILRLKSFPSP